MIFLSHKELNKGQLFFRVKKRVVTISLGKEWNTNPLKSWKCYHPCGQSGDGVKSSIQSQEWYMQFCSQQKYDTVNEFQGRSVWILKICHSVNSWNWPYISKEILCNHHQNRYLWFELPPVIIAEFVRCRCTSQTRCRLGVLAWCLWPGYPRHRRRLRRCRTLGSGDRSPGWRCCMKSVGFAI